MRWLILMSRLPLKWCHDARRDSCRRKIEGAKCRRLTWSGQAHNRRRKEDKHPAISAVTISLSKLVESEEPSTWKRQSCYWGAVKNGLEENPSCLKLAECCTHTSIRQKIWMCENSSKLRQILMRKAPCKGILSWQSLLCVAHTGFPFVRIRISRNWTR